LKEGNSLAYDKKTFIPDIPGQENDMNFRYYMPTRIIFGRDCVKKTAELLGSLGRKAFIVTGARSALINGSLGDITEALEDLKTGYIHFNKVEANPSVETVREGARICAQESCDFIIAIGGGSPMDAAKAMAVAAVNEVDDESLFSGIYPHRPLPVIAIPTTAGTGSEVTPYSILTCDSIKNKRSIRSDSLFPAISFLDSRYTEFMPVNTTVNTALDALSHSVEGYLSRQYIPAVGPFALESVSLLGQCLKSLAAGMSPESGDRDNLLYASMLGGMVIAHTGTTCVHAMGYPLTYYRNIDHGRANGLLMSEYLRFLEPGRRQVKDILSAMKLRDLDHFRELMDSLLGERESLSEEELDLFVETALTSRSIGLTDPSPDAARIREIFRKSLP
jgi:alcohol dehydrogenase class IV